VVQKKTVTRFQKYTEIIFNTMREPLIVLDQKLRVVSASRSFYDVFKVKPEETVGQLIYDLGNKQWDIPKLRELLEDILPKKTTINDYEVEHNFAVIGRSIMLLNARQIERGLGKERTILLAIEDITEQRRLQEESEANEERYRSVFESSQDGLLFVDRSKGDILNFNPYAQELLGYSKEEFLKNKLWGIGIVNDDKDFQQALSRLENDGVIYYDSISIKNKKGLLVITEVILVDKVRFIQCNIRDITERKQAEEALRETSNYLENLLSFANAPIMVWDNNNKVTKFNLAFERMTGYTMYDVLGKNPEILFSDDKRKEISTLISRTSDGENLISVELPVRCKNGIIRNVLWNTSNIYTKDAKTIIATIANGQDVTERKRAEESLQESELRFRSLYENATIGIYRSTPDGSILLANPALVKMLGYTSFQKLAERNLEIDGFEPSSQRKEFLDKIERDGEVKGYDSKWILQDGRTVFVLESVRAIRDAQGKTLYYDGTVEDITDRKQLEEGLRQMQKLEGLGTLAGGIAHDFNNILGIILAYITSTIRFKDDAEKLDLAVDTIVKAVERGKTLVQQILTFARRTETEFRPVNVNDIVKEIMVMIFETFPKILTYAQNIDQGVSYINADRSQLHQLLLNLCVNARDAMPKGGLLTINTQMVSGASLLRQHPGAVESSYVCIEVSDTGEGMAPEISRRIFEPFFTTKELGKGTGLGLAVVFGVIQTHKGFIDVESELGKGTTFSIYLPAPQIAEPIIEKKDEATLEETPGGTETLLVVEDEEMLMMTLQMLLVEKGYKVLSAEDGLTAVNIYKERRNEIALVLTDLGLPKMTGMEECAQIKKLNPSARVIIATGYLDSGMKSEFLKTGIQHFLFKPYDLKKVLKEIREVLDEK
jgi:PAS domain S-box-containing protein